MCRKQLFIWKIESVVVDVATVHNGFAVVVSGTDALLRVCNGTDFRNKVALPVIVVVVVVVAIHFLLILERPSSFLLWWIRLDVAAALQAAANRKPLLPPAKDLPTAAPKVAVAVPTL